MNPPKKNPIQKKEHLKNDVLTDLTNPIDEDDEIIGKFESDEGYLKAVKTLINCTEETNHRISFFENDILPHIKGKTILDIGVGNGELSESLYKHFEVIHLIDPSPLALNSISDEKFLNKEINKLNIKIEDFKFPINFYDLIVNCHTLYHVKRDHWKFIINKSFEALKFEGIQLIVLNSGMGRSKLTNFLGARNVINIETLIEECMSIENAFINIIPSYEQIQTFSLNEALQIVGIFLQDINLTASKDLLIDYLNKHCKKDKKFVIDYIQYFIILKKKA